MVTCWPSATSSMPTVTAPRRTQRRAVTCGSVGCSTGSGSGIGPPPSLACTRATSAATRCAFHGDHADALVAAPSAWARACSSWSSGGVARRSSSATRSIVAGSSMSRRVAVAGSSRWWRTSAASVATSGGENPIRAADLRRDGLAHLAVVARPALADVVQQRGDQQQVGPVDVPGQLGGGGRRLDQVPVDGEPVPRVALRQRPHPVPLGHQPGEQALLVQLLQHRHGGAAAGQQPEEGPAHLRPATARAAAGCAPRAPSACTARAAGPPGPRRPRRAAAGRGRRPGCASRASTTSSPWRTTPSASGSRRTRR